ncbi:MAG: leucyl/phenylalanyl-tRNA--protein transferase [Gammaproteobacteria bacterium]|nr:leucyl/phenylalanyl-tRNA--protein transferase [Gammaproteobacteria bacterium]
MAISQPLYWIAGNVLVDGFPDANAALTEPDGLLAAGGDLEPGTLLDAYRRGIFPWYVSAQPILWWSPDPRCVFRPAAMTRSRSLRKRLRQQRFEVTIDRDFPAVIRACAAPRGDRAGTWIVDDMVRAYVRLHALGHAHSVECWRAGRLVGGIYGLAIGRVFFGESMFSADRDASKVALAWLAHNLDAWRYALLDGQVTSGHLLSLGAETMPRARFLARLAELCPQAPAADAWRSWNAPS